MLSNYILNNHKVNIIFQSLFILFYIRLNKFDNPNYEATLSYLFSLLILLPNKSYLKERNTRSVFLRSNTRSVLQERDRNKKEGFVPHPSSPARDSVLRLSNKFYDLKKGTV